MQQLSDDESGDLSEDLPSTPVKTGKKRSAIDGISKPRRKRARSSGIDAIFGVANAIRDFSSAFRTDGQASQCEVTPQRRARAMKMAEDEDDMSDDEAVAVAKMFRGNMNIVDTYLAIPSQARRRKYLRSELDDFYASRL